MVREMPPVTTGNATTDLLRMREYLVRLADNLGQVTETQARIETGTGTEAEKRAAKAAQEAVENLKAQAAKLKALIIKTADEVYEYVDGEYTEERNRVYLAQSDFGSYLRNESVYIQGLATGVIENYDVFSAIETQLGNYYNQISGYIRRGIVTDPSTQEEVIGIAIAQDNIFTSETQSEDGIDYYRIASGQTFGLYTSTGWQFWINGQKRGYFSSEDGMLHVSNVYVESILQVSDKWQIVNANGLGIRYIG